MVNPIEIVRRSHMGCDYEVVMEYTNGMLGITNIRSLDTGLTITYQPVGWPTSGNSELDAMHLLRETSILFQSQPTQGPLVERNVALRQSPEIEKPYRVVDLGDDQ